MRYKFTFRAYSVSLDVGWSFRPELQLSSSPFVRSDSFFALFFVIFRTLMSIEP